MPETDGRRIATHFAATAAPWLSYQHPAVRDLVWLIASAPLICDAPTCDAPTCDDSPVAALPANAAIWPDAASYLALYTRHEPWLRQLDADPQALLTFIAQARDYRLGRYAEDLLHFWFAAPDNLEFTLVASHMPLREHGITLGEPDFVVRERSSGKLWHIELALKFYLGTADQQWLGPNRQDSLARKLNHLRQHQLPLLKTPAGQAWLQTQGLYTPTPWAWLKGRLFTPFAASTGTTAAHAGHDAITPCWFTPRELHTFSQNQHCQWHTLAKNHWLATGSSTPEQHPVFDIEDALSTFPDTGSQALIAFQGEREVLRAFVVGESWAQAPISSR
ncbi:MAG: DUF1853 family protein [Pseudomonadota bacterium]